MIKNKDDLKKVSQKYNIPLLEIESIDTIDYNGKGKMSVNCLPLPGMLIGGSHFQTTGIEEKLGSMGIQHIVTPITQFNYSGGGYHCLTNELSD